MMGIHAIVSGNTAWRNSGFAAEGTFQLESTLD
eukprot:SAG31_NODE_106_length_24954_cov_17.726413_14_plen_33_part_00